MTTARGLQPDGQARLITIGVSHYCEKARWGLDRMNVKYTEESHAPIAHLLAVFRAGGKRTVPVLVTDDGVFADSTDILKYVDPFGPEEARLYPDDRAARREVEEVEDLCDEKLGPRTRRWAYAWIIDDRNLMRSFLESTMTKRERAMSAVLVPFTVAGIRRSYHLSSNVRESAFEKIRSLFSSLDERLASQKYLAGDFFSAADLTFAALATPALGPPEHPWPLPKLADLPRGMQKQIEELRATKSGAHALKMYREERNRVFFP